MKRKSDAVFHSILFEGWEEANRAETTEAPAFFGDLNLDQIVEAITASRKQYDLKPFFFRPLTEVSAVAYRHEIMRDLEEEVLFQRIQAFAERMHRMRNFLAGAEQNHSYKYSRERWFLDAVETYCRAVEELLQDLVRGRPRSRGLLAFQQYLTRYTESGPFKTLREETQKLESDLSAIRYCVLVHGRNVTVRNHDSETEVDYTAAVEETFSKFKEGAGKDYRVHLPASSGMGHIEAQILSGVAQLNPEVFAALDEYCARNREFLDKTVRRFDREVQFYVAYQEYMETFKRAGLKFCYPRVSESRESVFCREGFDLGLAGKLVREEGSVVCNDFSLDDPERIFVVTGPNQGGKTTFARMFGQMLYLANLGCPVPGEEARLFLFDRLFTHFERAEEIANLRGKLQDDLVRLRGILDQATPNSILILNEVFSSATRKDAVYLGRKVLERISKMDALGVCVTFLDELSSLNEKTVSVVAAVAPEDATRRTYRVERRPADGLAYAQAIAEKYHLTYERLKERMEP